MPPSTSMDTVLGTGLAKFSFWWCIVYAAGAGIAVDGTFTQQGGTARVMKCMSATGQDVLVAPF